MALSRGFPKSHPLARARAVFGVASHRCREVFDPPQGITLWKLPPVMLGRARQALSNKWPFLDSEPDITAEDRTAAADLDDLLRRETFYRELPRIDQAATQLGKLYAERFQRAVQDRADCYRQALDQLRPHEMLASLSDLERFLHDRESLPLLIHCGLTHAQFETIHPFLDGNGRIGRLLISFLLCERKVLQRPLLYLSYYFKAHRAQYYDRLMAIRNAGDWEGWLKFFLRGVYEVSLAATDTAREILTLREQHRELLTENSHSTAYALKLLDLMYQQPVFSIKTARVHLDCVYHTAASVVQQFEDLGLIHEITGRQRNRLYRYGGYVSLFERQGLPTAETQDVPSQTSDAEEKSEASGESERKTANSGRSSRKRSPRSRGGNT